MEKKVPGVPDVPDILRVKRLEYSKLLLTPNLYYERNYCFTS
jgi:hypothetical protein